MSVNENYVEVMNSKISKLTKDGTKRLHLIINRN